MGVVGDEGGMQRRHPQHETDDPQAPKSSPLAYTQPNPRSTTPSFPESLNPKPPLPRIPVLPPQSQVAAAPAASFLGSRSRDMHRTATRERLGGSSIMEAAQVRTPSCSP